MSHRIQLTFTMGCLHMPNSRVLLMGDEQDIYQQTTQVTY